jgi:hypothetical protein
MKAKQAKILEGYFKTENDHWNEFILEMLCQILRQEKFENPQLPLELFNNATNMFVQKHQTPLQAVHQFGIDLDKKKLSANQKLFLYKWVWKYLNETEFEKLDLTPIRDLLESQKEKLQAENEPRKPPQKDIRETLKEIMQNEFEQLPETLKGLEPMQRLTIICKFAPFILPKIEAVNIND